MTREELGERSVFLKSGPILLLALSWIAFNAHTAWAQAKAPCKEMRKIKLGVAVSPPNVVHTPVYVARALGIFADHCIEAEIVEFEGGASAANLAAVTQGQALATINAVAIAQGLKAKQIWGMAPRLPQAYMVSEEIKTAADLKGKRLSATGGGVGGLNWVMGREVLKTAGLRSTMPSSSPRPQPGDSRVSLPARSTALRSILKMSISPRRKNPGCTRSWIFPS